jgi:ribonucleoside-diphosphate reductase alpha chain
MAGSGSDYGQLQNCFVLAADGRHIADAQGDTDSIDGIYELAYKLAKVTKTGGGCGVYLGNLRESGSKVAGSGGVSSGPISFLRHLYATTLRVIRLEGVRRGAGMATLPISHPDVLDFITAKDLDREEVEGKIESFNISLLVTGGFLEAVEKDALWWFKSPRDTFVPPSPVQGKYHLPGQPATSVTGSGAPTSIEIPLQGGQGIRRPPGEAPWPGGPEKFRPGIAVPARWLWQQVIDHAWETGDPGILFHDEINGYWPLINSPEWGPIDATNPCGEEPLFPGESCCLGSMVLSTYVSSDGDFDIETFEEDVGLAVRFLDNVLTMNVHPLPETEETCDKLRRVGLGVMGLADALIKMGVPYAGPEGNGLMIYTLRQAALKASQELSVERGVFPAYHDLPQYSKITGRRNVLILSIAPTGTISMVSDTSSGIEPIFALAMQRRIGDEYELRVHPLFEQLLDDTRGHQWRDDEIDHDVREGIDRLGHPQYVRTKVPRIIKKVLDNHGSIRGLNEFTAHEQDIYVTAHDITPEEHVILQGRWQRGLDGTDGEIPMAAISKTVNLPTDATPDVVREVYDLARRERCRGVTIYRDGSRSDQVLTTKGKEEEPEKVERLVQEADIVELEFSTNGQHWPVPQVTRRPRQTQGKMTKGEFYTAGGAERKVYVYIGTDEDGYPVEVFVTDEHGGAEVHAYAAALGKLISLSLKHIVPPAAIAHRLRGLIGGSTCFFEGGIYQSVPDMVARLLEEAIEDFELSFHGEDDFEDDDDEQEVTAASGMLGHPRIEVPQSCANHVWRMEQGCKVCVNCGYSDCG